MPIDSQRFFEISKKAGLEVNVPICGTFLREFMEFKQRKSVIERLLKIKEQAEKLSVFTRGANNQSWQDNKYKTSCLNSFGTTHLSTSGMFNYIDELAVEFEGKIKEIINDENEYFVFVIRFDGENFKAIEVSLSEYYSLLEDDSFLLPSLSAKKKIKGRYSDEVIQLLAFWLNNNGELRFSAGSNFSRFCFNFLSDCELNQSVNLDSMEKRLKSLGISEKRVGFFLKNPNKNIEIEKV